MSRTLLVWGVLCCACRTAEAPAAPSVDASTNIQPPAMDAAVAVDADAAAVTALREALAAGAYDGAYIGAAALHTTVLDRMEWPPESDAGPNPEAGVRLGYVRYGAKVAALTEPFSNEAC